MCLRIHYELTVHFKVCYVLFRIFDCDEDRVLEYENKVYKRSK